MSRALSASTSLLLLAGLAAAVALRIAVGMPEVAQSQTGGVVFVASLALVVIASGWRPGRTTWTSIAVGVAGAGVLVAGPVWLHLASPQFEPSLPFSSFPEWAILIVLIAGTEEVALRGALFQACLPNVGPTGAVAITSIAFAIIHVPLYGPSAIPLDLAVGMWLGGLRLVTGGVAAPATAHIVADLCAWWLV